MWLVSSISRSSASRRIKSHPAFDRVENIVGNGENAGYQHFLLFPQCFQKASMSGSLKVGIMRERVKRPEGEKYILINVRKSRKAGEKRSILYESIAHPFTNDDFWRFWRKEEETRCVCETLMHPKHPSFEKQDPDIWPWPLQMTLTLVPGDVYRWDMPSYQIWAL